MKLIMNSDRYFYKTIIIELEKLSERKKELFEKIAGEVRALYNKYVYGFNTNDPLFFFDFSKYIISYIKSGKNKNYNLKFMNDFYKHLGKYYLFLNSRNVKDKRCKRDIDNMPSQVFREITYTFLTNAINILKLNKHKKITEFNISANDKHHCIMVLGKNATLQNLIDELDYLHKKKIQVGNHAFFKLSKQIEKLKKDRDKIAKGISFMMRKNKNGEKDLTIKSMKIKLEELNKKIKETEETKKKYIKDYFGLTADFAANVTILSNILTSYKLRFMSKKKTSSFTLQYEHHLFKYDPKNNTLHLPKIGRVRTGKIKIPKNGKIARVQVVKNYKKNVWELHIKVKYPKFEKNDNKILIRVKNSTIYLSNDKVIKINKRYKNLCKFLNKLSKWEKWDNILYERLNIMIQEILKENKFVKALIKSKINKKTSLNKFVKYLNRTPIETLCDMIIEEIINASNITNKIELDEILKKIENNKSKEVLTAIITKILNSIREGKNNHLSNYLKKVVKEEIKNLGIKNRLEERRILIKRCNGLKRKISNIADDLINKLSLYIFPKYSEVYLVYDEEDMKINREVLKSNKFTGNFTHDYLQKLINALKRRSEMINESVFITSSVEKIINNFNKNWNKISSIKKCCYNKNNHISAYKDGGVKCRCCGRYFDTKYKELLYTALLHEMAHRSPCQSIILRHKDFEEIGLRKRRFGESQALKNYEYEKFLYNRNADKDMEVVSIDELMKEAVKWEKLGKKKNEEVINIEEKEQKIKEEVVSFKELVNELAEKVKEKTRKHKIQLLKQGKFKEFLKIATPEERRKLGLYINMKGWKNKEKEYKKWEEMGVGEEWFIKELGLHVLPYTSVADLYLTRIIGKLEDIVE